MPQKIRLKTQSLVTQANMIVGDVDGNGSELALGDAQFAIGLSGTAIIAAAISGDISVSNAGVAAIGSGVIVNADIAGPGTANIDATKLTSTLETLLVGKGPGTAMGELAIGTPTQILGVSAGTAVAWQNAPSFSAAIAWDQAPTNLPNGTFTAFTFSGTPLTNSIAVYLNGVRQRITEDITVSSNVVTFVNYTPATIENINADYQTA